MSKYYVGDKGTEVLVDTGSLVDTATTMQLLVKKPSGKEVTWTATLGPPNAQGEFTKLKYIIKVDDWDEPGFYTLQSYVVLPAWTGRGDSVKFKIDVPFK